MGSFQASREKIGAEGPLGTSAARSHPKSAILGFLKAGWRPKQLWTPIAYFELFFLTAFPVELALLDAFCPIDNLSSWFKCSVFSFFRFEAAVSTTGVVFRFTAGTTGFVVLDFAAGDLEEATGSLADLALVELFEVVFTFGFLPF